jgi:uncharacterized protein (DUF2141 family)
MQCVVAATLFGAGMVQASDLSVEVAGLKSAKGKLLFAVYDRAEDFLKQPIRTTAVDAHPGKVWAVIADLPPGDYALSVFQDENGNGKLDANPTGMPIEPYGFSNDAEGSYGPPSFKASLVHLSGPSGLTTIKLR